MKDILIFILFVVALILWVDWLRLKRAQKAPPSPPPSIAPLPTEEITNREITRLLDAFPDPFFSISQDGKLKRINRAAEKIFVGRNILDRSYQSIFLEAPLIEEIQRALESRKPHSTILRLPPNSPFSIAAPEKESHWEVTLSPLSLKLNNQELQVMMRDISASIHTDQVRQDFVANASHELRTPLSIISGYLENLREDGVLEDVAMSQKMLGTMSRHVDRINRIVEDMLVISKLTSSKDWNRSSKHKTRKSPSRFLKSTLKEIVSTGRRFFSTLLKTP